MSPPKRISSLPNTALGRGATLGGYTIVAPLEVGGMATLYLAHPAGAPARRLVWSLLLQATLIVAAGYAA